MRRLALIVALALAAGVVFSDAIVLPPMTVIHFSDGKADMTLQSGMFLLDRADMEKATLALETVPIREQEVKDITASYHALAIRKDLWKFIAFTATGAGAGAILTKGDDTATIVGAIVGLGVGILSGLTGL